MLIMSPSPLKYAGQRGTHIPETKVPTSYAEQLFSISNLDNIGPARYVENLDELNQVHFGISESME
jgi:hypothetical protein